jgi:tetratricopeptide (TPR) repeat protein
MATKESMATAPVMVLLYDVVFGAGSVRRALRQRPALYAGLALTWIIVGAIVLSGPRSRSAGLSSGVTPWNYLLNQPPVILNYLRLAVWPHPLVLDYGMPRSVAIAEVVPAAIAVIVLLAGTVALWRRHRPVAYLCTWFFVTLAPTSTVVPIATEVAAERRMYLPLAACVVLAVVGVASAVGRLASGRTRPPVRIAAGLLAAVCIVLVTLTVRRNGEYRTSVGIWQTVLDRRPQPRAHYNMGIALKGEGRRDEAMREYRAAAAGGLADAHYALGFELDLEGKHAEAVAHLTEYVRRVPDDMNVIRAHALLGRALMTLGRRPEAEAAFRQVLRMQPRNMDAIGGLADTLVAERRFDEAIETYRSYIGLAPDHPVPHFNMGLALRQAGKIEEAALAFAAAVNLAPGEAAFQVNLASALEALGRTDEALSHYRTAIRLQPEDAELRAYVDQLAADHGRTTGL